MRGFAVYHFEAFTLGIQSALDKIDADSSAQIERLGKIFYDVKADSTFIGVTSGGGRNTKNALEARVQFVRERIPQDL